MNIEMPADSFVVRIRRAQNFQGHHKISFF